MHFEHSETLRNAEVSDPRFAAALSRMDELVEAAVEQDEESPEYDAYIHILQERVWSREEIAALIGLLDICSVVMLFWQRLDVSATNGQALIFQDMLLGHFDGCPDCQMYLKSFRDTEELSRDHEPDKAVAAS